MQTKNLTPFLFGTKVTSLRPPQVQMTMIVKATFKLRPGEPVTPIEELTEQGPLTADVFREEDEERRGECLQASDFADFKLHAEVLLSGTCHAPGGRPAIECPVRFSVGAWSKSLLVVGRRVWTEKVLGAAISEPQPFVTMPLDYAQSFGGPAYPRNPAGKGHGTPELPTVEHPSARIRSRGDTPEPAGFGPLNPAWPQRAGKVGKEYGRKWKKERAPFYAEDFDWTHFQAAPLDQQLPGYLRGDEEVSFVNLHPAAPSFSARLPGLRIRALVKDTAGVIREARMNLDTLLADLDKEVLVLTWRGLAAVTQDDLTDVRTVLIASEKLGDPVLPEAHYQAMIEAFEADPLETDRYVPGGRKALAALDAAAKDEVDHPERSPNERLLALLQNDDILAMVPEAQRAAAEESVGKMKAALASAPSPTAPAPTPAEALPAMFAKLGDLVKQLRTLTEEAGAPTADVEEMERFLEDPERKKALAALTPVRPEEIGPGKDLSGRNLGKLDLSGKDLSGANLEGAILMGAKLAGARLAGANLRQAVLADADLTGADLSGADLTRALLSGARAPGADLQKATLDQTLFQKTDLRGACLAGARGEMTLLSEADLSGANLRACDLHKAFGDQTVLESADVSEAKLVGCAFLRARAAGALLTRTFLGGTSFADADLRGAKLGEARGEGTNWSRADLGGADFRFAALPAAHFMEAKAVGTAFFGADLRGSEFYRACLDRAELVKANLMGANLNKSTLNGTRFRDANLYEAKLLGAGGKDTDFNGANLKRAMFPAS